MVVFLLPFQPALMPFCRTVYPRHCKGTSATRERSTVFLAALRGRGQRDRGSLDTPELNVLKCLCKPGKTTPMGTVTFSTKGQLVIPSRFRKVMHLQPGDGVSVSLEGEKLILTCLHD